ncbi:MAG: hypothetical protein JSR72_23645 [Proteobacteria bacterium]|nr:hypothetical protein [Pseudomonadota bacterium]
MSLVNAGSGFESNPFAVFVETTVRQLLAGQQVQVQLPAGYGGEDARGDALKKQGIIQFQAEDFGNVGGGFHAYDSVDWMQRLTLYLASTASPFDVASQHTFQSNEPLAG